jgi:hypothetical protein
MLPRGFSNAGAVGNKTKSTLHEREREARLVRESFKPFFVAIVSALLFSYLAIRSE